MAFFFLGERVDFVFVVVMLVEILRSASASEMLASIS